MVNHFCTSLNADIPRTRKDIKKRSFQFFQYFHIKKIHFMSALSVSTQLELIRVNFYVYSHHSILECYNLFSGVELSMRSFFVILATAVAGENNHMALSFSC